MRDSGGGSVLPAEPTPPLEVWNVREHSLLPSGNFAFLSELLSILDGACGIPKVCFAIPSSGNLEFIKQALKEIIFGSFPSVNGPEETELLSQCCEAHLLQARGICSPPMAAATQTSCAPSQTLEGGMTVISHLGSNVGK